MNTTTLVIEDQVNCRFKDVDPFVRRKLVEALKFTVPYARHTPAYKLGRWDGRVSFCTVGGGTYINLLDVALPILVENGYEIEIEDHRPEYSFVFPKVTEDVHSQIAWPAGHPLAGEPIMLRDHQVEAINRYAENIQSMQCIPTGGGKTLITATLSQMVEPYGRTLVIVPNKDLVTQTEEDYRNIGLDVGVYYGDRKEVGHTHTIATWQSLTVFAKKGRRGETDFSKIADVEGFAEFVEGVVCVIVDEAHTAKGNELRSLLCGPLAHVPIRWGMTGTVPKEDWEFMNLLVSIGPVVGEIQAADLQEKGILANCHVDIVRLDDSHVSFNNYTDEHAFLVSDKRRLTWIANYCSQIAQTGNTLILVENIECGEFLTQHIPGAVFVNGRMSSKKRKAEYKSVHQADNKVIIATYGVAAVGINIPRIFNLVLIEAGKAFTRVIQSIGRGLRKAHDKDFVNIVDICSTLKYSSRHLTKRKNYYKDAKYEHSVRKVSYY